MCPKCTTNKSFLSRTLLHTRCTTENNALNNSNITTSTPPEHPKKCTKHHPNHPNRTKNDLKNTNENNETCASQLPQKHAPKQKGCPKTTKINHKTKKTPSPKKQNKIYTNLTNENNKQKTLPIPPPRARPCQQEPCEAQALSLAAAQGTVEVHRHGETSKSSRFFFPPCPELRWGFFGKKTTEVSYFVGRFLVVWPRFCCSFLVWPRFFCVVFCVPKSIVP